MKQLESILAVTDFSARARHAADRAARLEQEQDCDLVVLGKHGQSVAEDLLLGSVSLHVLAEGSIDVLVSTAQAA